MEETKFMPIFKYKCNTCNTLFGVIITRDIQITCPNCKSNNIKKVYTTFGTSFSEHFGDFDGITKSESDRILDETEKMEEENLKNY